MNKLLTSKGANIFVVPGQKPNNTCFNTRLNFDVDKALYIYRKQKPTKIIVQIHYFYDIHRTYVIRLQLISIFATDDRKIIWKNE